MYTQDLERKLRHYEHVLEHYERTTRELHTRLADDGLQAVADLSRARISF